MLNETAMMTAIRWRFERTLAIPCASLVTCLVLAPTSARADEPAAPVPILGASPALRPPLVGVAPGSEDPRASKLRIFLGESAREARASRRAILLTGIVAGAAMVPVGVTLWQRSDAVSQSIGAGLTIGGASPAAFSLLSLSQSSIERLADDYEARRESGESAVDVVGATEVEWAEIASASHDRRMVTGVAAGVLGCAATVVGIEVLLSNPIGGWSRDTQNTIGSVLVGAGVPVFSLGIRALLQETPEERWWAIYRATGASGQSARPAPPAFIPSVSFVPMPGGFFAGATMPL